jgi:mutator protein MutT
MTTLGAFAVIFDTSQRVLLCHRRDRDQWNLPGGRVEPGESPWEAVVREVREEAGLVVRVEKLLGVYAVPARDDLVFNFLCLQIGGEICTTDEADDVRWFSRHDIPPNVSPRQLARIQDAYDQPEEVLLRNQL